MYFLKSVSFYWQLILCSEHNYRGFACGKLKDTGERHLIIITDKPESAMVEKQVLCKYREEELYFNRSEGGVKKVSWRR